MPLVQEIIKFTIEPLVFQNRPLNGAHSIWDIKLPWKNQTIIRDFNSENRNATWVSKWDEYHNYWVLINAFWIRLDLSDIDMWDMDLSDTDLDFLDTDTPTKHSQ